MADPDPPDRPRRPTTSQLNEAFFKRQLDTSNNEKTQLQSRVRQLETQNKALLKSLFEISSTPPSATAAKPLPVDVVSALRRLALESQDAPTAPGKGSAYRRSAPDHRNNTSAQAPGGLRPHISTDYSPFCARADLQGHASAVYATQFSPDGLLLASVSFDRSVRFWPINRFLEKSANDEQKAVLDAHRAPVVAVEWTFDSAKVVTGALDQSAAEWDVEASHNEALSRFACDGLVNAVSVSPANDNLFFVATSRRTIHLFDRRFPPPRPAAGEAVNHSNTTIVENESIVNTVHVTLDGSRFITGDHEGGIRTWDIRASSGPVAVGAQKRYTAGLIDVTVNDDARRPITHIHTSPPLSGEEHGRFMAVNSYDAFLRVYDRGAFFFRSTTAELKAVQALRGVVGSNWPIKSSFFLGADYRPPTRGNRRSTRRRRSRVTGRERISEGRSTKSEAAEGHEDEDDEYASGSDAEDGSSSSLSGQSDGEDTPSAADPVVGGRIQNSLILASGSADGRVYVFDVASSTGEGGLLQTLEGHRDRVYAVDFHPSEPILASCSADSDIKIWHSR